jgi:hypothetical protein
VLLASTQDEMNESFNQVLVSCTRETGTAETDIEIQSNKFVGVISVSGRSGQHSGKHLLFAQPFAQALGLLSNVPIFRSLQESREQVTMRILTAIFITLSVFSIGCMSNEVERQNAPGDLSQMGISAIQDAVDSFLVQNLEEISSMDTGKSIDTSAPQILNICDEPGYSNNMNALMTELLASSLESMSSDDPAALIAIEYNAGCELHLHVASLWAQGLIDKND